MKRLPEAIACCWISRTEGTDSPVATPEVINPEDIFSNATIQGIIPSPTFEGVVTYLTSEDIVAMLNCFNWYNAIALL
ncbi:hypothetical protein [Nostoc sp.]|uniref:hypothetical protein n=1 Tax=Nostoc sp. TaxID=1180 RepID=UPI002FF948EC